MQDFPGDREFQGPLGYGGFQDSPEHKESQGLSGNKEFQGRPEHSKFDTDSSELDFSDLYGYTDPDVFGVDASLDDRDLGESSAAQPGGPSKWARTHDYLKDEEYVYDQEILRSEIKVVPLKRYRGGGIDFIECSFRAGSFRCIYSIPLYPPELLNFARRAYEAILYRSDLPVDHPLGYLAVRDVVAESISNRIWPEFSCQIKQSELKIVDLYVRRLDNFAAMMIKNGEAVHIAALPVKPRMDDYNRLARTMRASGVRASKGLVMASLSHISPEIEVIERGYQKYGALQGVAAKDLENMFEVRDWRR